MSPLHLHHDERANVESHPGTSTRPEGTERTDLIHTRIVSSKIHIFVDVVNDRVGCNCFPGNQCRPEDYAHKTEKALKQDPDDLEILGQVQNKILLILNAIGAVHKRRPHFS